MFQRVTIFLLACLTLAALAVTASAATIDPELELLMSEKDGDLIPVLMLFDEEPDLEDLILELEKAPPSKRRKSVIVRLKKVVRKSQADAMDLLTGPDRVGSVKRVRQLYLVNAIAFVGDRTAIEAVAAGKDAATLVIDRLVDPIASQQRDPQEGDDAFAKDRDVVWNVSWINADDVWNDLGFTGDGVLVGHIDSGVYLTHPDLRNRIWENPGEIPDNGIDDDSNGFVDDVQGWDFGGSVSDGEGGYIPDNNPNDDNPGGGHGTHTAGTVCGDGTGGTQTGVAPGATLIPCKVFNYAGEATVGEVWEAEQYLVENGARVITMSMGVSGDALPVSLLRSDRNLMNNMRAAGVLMVNSAGNEHNAFNPPYEVGMTGRVPAPWNELDVPFSSTSGVVTVGGTGYQTNSPYGDSSRGPVTWGDIDPWLDWPYDPNDGDPPGLIKPDISAPGGGVNSTIRPSGYSGNTWWGTSMSCPHIAGVAALMLEKNPTLSPAGLDSLIEQTALDLYLPGKDNMFGAGLVNAYDAVQAVPTDQVPDLFVTGFEPDPNGDGSIDPGMTTELIYQLSNVSTLVTATGVEAGLAVIANDYVTIADGSAVYPDIPVDGSAWNSADPFSVAVDAAAPQGFEFTLLLTVTTDGGFERTFDLPAFIGLPDFKTHAVGNVFLTVTDQGIIGFMSDEQIEGDGMGEIGGPNALFVGSMWGGLPYTDFPYYICNRDFPGDGSENPPLEVYEWVVREDPTGRIRSVDGSLDSEQAFAAAFTDSGHWIPRQILVEQTSFAWANSPDDDFVIMEYHITNNGETAMPEYHVGIFCDWDVSSGDGGGLDEDRWLIYLAQKVGDELVGPFFGVVLLGESTPANLSFIRNETFVYDHIAIPDYWKCRFLTGATSVTSTPGAGADWSTICSAAVPLDVGAEATVAFAMVFGATLDDILANADAAIAAYSTSTPVSDDVPVKVFHLSQNHPNPFNPQTSIKYNVAREGHVELAVYDVSGRLVKTLVSATSAAGDYTATWDGTNEMGARVPSGTYLYKLSAGVDTQTRKMTLVK